VPPRKQQVLLMAAVERDGAGQEALLAGDVPGARAAFAAAAGLYRQSWEAAHPTAFGRLVGMLKSSVLAGGGGAEAEYVRGALAGAAVESVTAAYARALAALILDQDEEARDWAGRMASGNEAFARTGEALAALAIRDQDRYEAALGAIVRDFEARAQHLTGVAIADTALVLGELGTRRGMAVAIESPVLPPMSAL
jgi:hypothetical protein